MRTEEPVASPQTGSGQAPVFAASQAASLSEIHRFEASLSDESLAQDFDTPGTGDYQGQDAGSFRALARMVITAPGHTEPCTEFEAYRIVNVLIAGCFSPIEMGVILIGDSSLGFKTLLRTTRGIMF